MNYTLLAYLFIIVLLALYAATYPAHLYAVRRVPASKVTAMERLIVMSALANASRVFALTGDNVSAVEAFCLHVADSVARLDSRVIEIPIIEIEDGWVVFAAWEEEPGRIHGVAFAKVRFVHSWGWVSIAVFLNASMVLEPVSPTIYRARVHVLSDTPVLVRFGAINATALLVHRLPDQTYELLIVVRGEQPRLVLYDERGIVLELPVIPPY